MLQIQMNLFNWYYFYVQKKLAMLMAAIPIDSGLSNTIFKRKYFLSKVCINFAL